MSDEIPIGPGNPSGDYGDLSALDCSPSGVVSAIFGELKLSGCEKHPHQLNLSCCKIRQADGKALTTNQIWEVLNELAVAKRGVMMCDQCGKRSSNCAPDEGDGGWWCLDCIEAWEKKHKQHWEDGSPFEAV